MEGQSLDHLIRIPPFGLWGEIGGHLGNWYKQQKRGGNFWFLSPSYLLFMDYILHMSFHIRKQGRTLNMPITAIEITNLFCGHRVRHCFRPKCFIYKTFLLKGQVSILAHISIKFNKTFSLYLFLAKFKVVLINCIFPFIYPLELSILSKLAIKFGFDLS